MLGKDCSGLVAKMGNGHTRCSSRGGGSNVEQSLGYPGHLKVLSIEMDLAN
jgi:hypothetical protein